MPEHKSLPLEPVKELNNNQREDFARMLVSILNSFNARHDKLHSVVIELKHSLEFSQKQIDEMTAKLASSADSLETTDKEIGALKGTLSDLTDKAGYLENQSIRNNVIFDGITEAPGETWEDTEKKIANALQINVGLSELRPIERVHRIGKGVDKPRKIVVKLTNYKDRESILRNGKKLKGSDIYVKDDVFERVQARRREQMDKL